MPSEDALRRAVDAEIITAEQSERLSAFWADTGIDAPRVSSGRSITSKMEPVDDNEAPRFLRGFHDILITIGLGVGLAGGFSLLSVLWMLPIIWGLSEYFIRVQRLALPAVFLSVVWSLTAIFAVSAAMPWIGDLDDITSDAAALRFIVWSAITAICTCVFFFRFRTPVSLAGFWLSVCACLFGVASYGYLSVTQLTQEDPGFWVIDILFPLIGALGLFAIACWFDFSDPTRKTRRSDTAFWLHMVAAPALLFTVLNVLHAGGVGFFEKLDQTNPVIVLPVLLSFVVIGVLLDRRAFVTSGMLSLGVAVGLIIEELDLEFGELAAMSAVAVSVIVLTVAVGWTPMRRILLPLLPKALSSRLPPAIPKLPKAA